MTFRAHAVALFAVLPALIAGSVAHAADTSRSGVDAELGSTRQLPGGAVLHLGPGTRLERVRTLKLQLGPPGSAETVTQVVKLSAGRVDVELPLSRAPKTAVLLQAPHKASAVAKGGHSIAIVGADRVTFAAVDGDMLAAAGEDWKPLPSGLVRDFVAGGATAEERAVPGVPRLDVPRPLLLATGAAATGATVQVAGVAQADHYELAVWRLGEKGRDFVRRVDVRGPASELAALPPGRYELSARAVDKTGIFGKECAPRPLRIVGTELPEGARFDNHVILLGQRGRVKLVGAEGLEASYGASAHFVRAPASVGLARGEATFVRLREPGGSDELKLALEPRTLRADVRISPRSARWPQDKIDVSIRLFDARGHAVSATTPVKVAVLVDVEPMDVSFTRVENLLTAHIPGAKGRGPWVLRVEVTDEFGDPAGRDFLEVAGGDSGRLSAR